MLLLEFDVDTTPTQLVVGQHLPFLVKMYLACLVLYMLPRLVYVEVVFVFEMACVICWGMG